MNYELFNDKLTVGFTELGGTLTSIEGRDGIEYLWQGDKQYWSGQSPVLFPICGSIRDDKAVVGNNKIMQMPRHGIVRKRPFKMTHLQDDSISFSLDSDTEMLNQFPFPFQLTTEYRLNGNIIEVIYHIRNHGTEIMPFQIGGHPGFNCPLDPNENFSDYYLKFETEETCSTPVPVTATGMIDQEHRSVILDHTDILPLDHSLFSQDAIILDDLESRKVSLLSKKTGRGIEMEFQDFPYLILWSTANKGPFIALEPWSGLSTCSDEDNIFEKKRNIQFAEPGEEKDYSYKIKVV